MPNWNIYHRGKQSGGLKAIKPHIGQEIYRKTCFHDDGVKGYGGLRVACIGPMRAGKTTLALETIPKFYHIDGVKKEDWFKNPNPDKAHQETVVYRGRKLDYWNAFNHHHYKKCFPNVEPRKLRIFVWHLDVVTFFEEDEKEEVMKPIKGLDVYRYVSQEDLYEHLIEGGINVVYVPNDYKLSKFLKVALNEMRMLQPDSSEYLTEDSVVSVINETFWYDLFYYMLGLENSDNGEVNGRRRLRSITFFFDEAHQIFPANQPKPFWYLIENFAENALIDSGRLNLTIYANIHALNLVHWKVLQRFDTFIWLFGSKPDKSYSMVNDKVPRNLKQGEFIIEEKQKQFGSGTFKQIPHQPFTVLAKGVV